MRIFWAVETICVLSRPRLVDNVPCPALFDFRDIELQQAIEPREQLLPEMIGVSMDAFETGLCKASLG